MITWQHNQGQAKRFSMNHFIQKSSIWNNLEKEKLKGVFYNLVTPQITPAFEPICLAQKPKEGTFIENYLKYGVGLMNKTYGLTGTIECQKPNKTEKGSYNDHLSVKPVQVIEKLLLAFSKENDIVLDPFMGSGTTAVAAQRTNRKWIGFEKEQHYCNIIQQRLYNATLNEFFT